jgi:hypothetical protein
MSELAPKPLSEEARRELQDWSRLLTEARGYDTAHEVLRNPQDAKPYRALAHKTHLSIYFLYQIYDWLLIYQHEVVKDILMPFHCPKCTYRIHPPEMLGN